MCSPIGYTARELRAGPTTVEETMYRKSLLAVAILVGFTVPSFADFYVAQGADKKCQTTDQKPDGKTMMMVGTATYKTKADADAAMKTAKECQ
jgi:hypothetical protein